MELERVRRRLDEGVNISLSPSSDTETDKEGDAAGDRIDMHGTDEIPQFESMSSSIIEELQGLLSDLSNDEISWHSASEPDVDGALLDLAGQGSIANPFQLAVRVKRELLRRAQASGSRAPEWDMSSFDKVGGSGTLRSVWNRLK